MTGMHSRDPARVVVVGGGFAGMASAARLAKLGHAVTLLEADDELGGSLRPVRHQGLSWDRRAGTLTLPAVLRDLFRKSGRPLEAELDLVPCSPGRRHLFPDGTVLDLPMGSRGAQHQALRSGLGDGPASTWTEHLDSMSAVWELLRRRTLEVPFRGRDAIDRDARAVLHPRRRLSAPPRALRRDPRLTAMLLDRHRLAGQEPRAVPAFLAVIDHVERGFGRWQPAGGMTALVPVLQRRLATRGVDVVLGTRAVDVLGAAGGVDGVVTTTGPRAADVVVWTAPRPPGLLAVDRRPPPAIPAARTYLGLRGHLPDLPVETFMHGDPLILVRRGTTDASGAVTWSLEHQPSGEDVVVTMARRGLDVRHQVTARVGLSPAQVVTEHGGSPAGMVWQGWRSGIRRPGTRTAVRGLYVIGADVHPGPGVVAAGLAAAQVATDVGKA